MGNRLWINRRWREEAADIKSNGTEKQMLAVGRFNPIKERRLEFMKVEIDNFLTMIEENIKPYTELMAFYRCVSMEIETKFRVLNEQLSLDMEHNPIEIIKTRMKSPDRIARKMIRKEIPLEISAIFPLFIRFTISLVLGNLL